MRRPVKPFSAVVLPGQRRVSYGKHRQRPALAHPSRMILLLWALRQTLPISHIMSDTCAARPRAHAPQPHSHGIQEQRACGSIISKQTKMRPRKMPRDAKHSGCKVKALFASDTERRFYAVYPPNARRAIEHLHTHATLLLTRTSSWCKWRWQRRRRHEQPGTCVKHRSRANARRHAGGRRTL